MTGFGHGSATVGDKRVRVEIRSVNHRGLDLKIRAREPDATCDAEIARAVRAVVDRGAVTVHLRDDSAAAGDSIDAAKVKTTFIELDHLRRELHIDAPVDLATVVAFMGASRSPGLTGEGLWEALRPAVTAALKELRQTRQREGMDLAEDLKERIKNLETITLRLESQSAVLPERFAQRLSDRLAAVPGQGAIDPRHLADICHAEGSVGRKLDFVIQEVGRELNTIGSKAQDAAVAGLVIDGKVELEKLREQAQNIE